MNRAMNIVSMIQTPGGVCIDEVPFYGTEREAYEAVKITATHLAKEIERQENSNSLVEMCDELYAQIWVNNIITARVEAIYEEIEA